METEKNEILEKNIKIIGLAARNSADSRERDIAWTLKRVQDTYPLIGTEECIYGLALYCGDQIVFEKLPRKIREYAFIHQTGDTLADWVNAQQEIARKMPIAIGTNSLKH